MPRFDNMDVALGKAVSSGLLLTGQSASVSSLMVLKDLEVTIPNPAATTNTKVLALESVAIDPFVVMFTLFKHYMSFGVGDTCTLRLGMSSGTSEFISIHSFPDTVVGVTRVYPTQYTSNGTVADGFGTLLTDVVVDSALDGYLIPRIVNRDSLPGAWTTGEMWMQVTTSGAGPFSGTVIPYVVCFSLKF